MTITERQGEILNRIVEDYIGLAQPISSEFLEKKHKFSVSPATIRIEMQRLTDGGFIFQPHTSAGRVPTDKGYRFFVDELIEKGISEFGEEFEIAKCLEEEIDNTVKFIQLLTKNLAVASSTLALSYLPKAKILWKEGWERVLREPEFREAECIFNFANFLKDFEEDIGDFEVNYPSVAKGGNERKFIDSQIHIYIGKENPFPRAKNFSIISSRCHLPDEEEGIISLLGPKRMAYDRNISLINSFKKILEKF